jgi:hypothetical protein
MKALLILLIAMNCMFFSCEKSGYGPKIKGKVVYTSCATVVIQVLDPLHYQLGQATWQQTSSSPVYNNVFAVENLCLYRAGNNIKVGDEVYFQLTNAGDADCAVCMLWDNPPAVKQRIFIVK